MASSRIKGTRLSIRIDDTEYKGDVTSYEFTHEDADEGLVTFGDAESGDTFDWFMSLGLVQSTDPDSLFMKFWENAGTRDVPFTLAPHGNETPSAAQPHLEGTLTLPLPETFGGEAGPGEFDTEATCKLDGKPTWVTV